MNGLGKFLLEIGVDINSLKTGLKDAESKIDNFGSKLENIGSKLTVGLSLPLGLMAKSALDAAGNFESLQTSFNTMLGSVEQGKVLMADLQKYNLKTSFESAEVAQATKSLLAFGFAQKEVIPNLSKIGDIASGVGMSVQELADIYGKARVQGTLMAEDINQLTGRGIPIIQEFAKQLNVSEGAVKNLASSGKITFANLEQAFISLTSEGGKFFNMTANQANTWQGVMSNASDAITQSLTTLGDTIIKSLNLKEVIPQATSYLADMVEAFKSLSPEAQKAITIIGGMAIVVPPILAMIGTALPMLASGFTALISPIGLVTVAIGALVAILGEHYLTTKKIESAMNSMEEVNQRVSDSIRDEINEATDLNAILQSNTTSYEEKKQALIRLQEINPKYFSGLNAENLNYSQLNSSLSKYIDSIQKAQQAKELFDKLSKNESLVQDLKKNPSKGVSYAEGVGIALLSPKGEQQFKNNVKNIVDSQIRTIEQENLRMKHKLTNLKLEGYGATPTTTTTPTKTTPTSTATSQETKAIQKQVDEELKLREQLYNDIQKLSIERISDTSRKEIEMLKFNTEKEIEEYKKRIDGHKELEDLFASWKLGKEKKLQDDIFAIQQKNINLPKLIKQHEVFKGFDMTKTANKMAKSLSDTIDFGTDPKWAAENIGKLERKLGLVQGTINKTNFSAFSDQAQVVLDSTNQMKDALQRLGAESAVTMGEMIGQMITGTETLKSVGLVLLNTLSQALAQFAMMKAVAGFKSIFEGNIAGGVKDIATGLGLGVGAGILKGMANKAQNQQQMQPSNAYSVVRGSDIYTAQNRYQTIKGF